MSFTCGQFDAELFSMANRTDFAANNNYEVDISERVEVSSAHEAVLSNVPIDDGTIYIEGLEEAEAGASTVTTGKFKVDAESKKLTFSADDEIDFVEVCYKYKQEAMEALITNKESAIGSCTCIWPVYNNGDDCTQGAIVGYYIIKVFRARITQIPGMDTSYRSAATLTELLSVA